MRRTAGRAFMALAGVCLLLAFISPLASAADDDEVPRPGVFNGNATARAISFNLDRTALLPINDVLNFIALEGHSEYGSSNQSARASLFFPGNGVLLGPSLVCGTFLGPQLPPEFKPILDACLQYNYPLTVFADSFQPDGTSVGSMALGKPTDDISGTAISAVAHAADDSATSNAVIHDLNVLGLPPIGPLALPLPANLNLDTSVASVDNASARTDQRIVKGLLTTTAKVSLSGIKLIGGLIKIGNIVSESTITDDGNGKRTADANLDIGGVTVAGTPAKITSKGIVLGDPSNTTPLGLARLAAINTLLQTLNIKITPLPLEETKEKNGVAVANAGGVLIEMARDVQGLPNIPSPVGEIDPNGVFTLTVQLASTGVLGAADSSLESSDDLSDDEDQAFDEDLGFDVSDDSVDFDSDVAFGDDSTDQAPREGSGSNSGSTGSLGVTRNLANNFGGRIGFVYLALMFTVLALCIAPRLAIPARFGRKP